MATPTRRHSCTTAAETLEWMTAIESFLRRYKHLMDAHVVNFFKDKLWETVDQEWIECLRRETVGNLLKLPSGCVQEHWPASLQDFGGAIGSLVLPREPNLSNLTFGDLDVPSLNNVLAQGMNLKKKHEVEILAALIKTIASDSCSETVIDVGAGQGYLAQALSFQYELSVIAIDASLHHARVTSARSERIKKHYASKLRNQQLKMPKTVTCHVLSSDTLTSLSSGTSQKHIDEKENETGSNLDVSAPSNIEVNKGKTYSSCNNHSIESSLVLAGLHACGDLSVNMLRSFVNCERVKAVISIGCCYNLLSEEGIEKTSVPCGFPVCNAAKLSGFVLGKNARDLACQSADRWRSLTSDAAYQNFELHADRAAFQMVLDKYFPEVIKSSPSIGRQGKALRRQQNQRARESGIGKGTDTISVDSLKEEFDAFKVHSQTGFSSDTSQKEVEGLERSGKYLRFKEFSESGLRRLGLRNSQDIDFLQIWREAQPCAEFVGPYWSLRAALGPLVETYILLDRLLFLQEQGDSVQARLFPLFDATISPRNVAIIAQKIG